MPITYRRPGVYLEESLLVNSADTASTFTVGCFIGVAEKGPILDPIRIDSWSDYVTMFGGFNPITPPAATDPNDVTTESFGRPTTPTSPRCRPTRPTAPATSLVFRSRLGSTSSSTTVPWPTTRRRRWRPTGRRPLRTRCSRQTRTSPPLMRPTPPSWHLEPARFNGHPRHRWGCSDKWHLHTDVLGVTTAGHRLQRRLHGGQDGHRRRHSQATRSRLLVALSTRRSPASPSPATGHCPGHSRSIPLASMRVPRLTSTTPTPGSGEGFVAAPTSAWTTGQNIWIGEHAFYWNGTAWAAGTAGGGQAKNNNGLWVVGKMTGTGQTIPPITKVQSYLPFAVYSYFQSGGRTCWVVRATPTSRSRTR